MFEFFLIFLDEFVKLFIFFIIFEVIGSLLNVYGSYLFSLVIGLEGLYLFGWVRELNLVK